LSAGDVILILAAVVVLAAIVVLANYADQKKNPRLRRDVIATFAFFNVTILLLYGLFPVIAVSVPSSSPPSFGKTEAWVGFLVALVLVVMTTALLLRSVRLKLARIFPSYRKLKNEMSVPAPLFPQAPVMPQFGDTPLFPQMLNYYTTSTQNPILPPVFEEQPAAQIDKVRGFNPDSSVHLVAVIFCFYLFGVQLIEFVLGGGLSGVAESLSEGISVGELMLNAFPEILLPLLGVGLGIRRNLPQTLKRLGLELPSMEGILVSAGITIALFVFIITASLLWQAVVSKETFEKQNQASDALANSISTLGMAFLVSLSAAVGEEILFRGAMQPVFGLWPTAITFALIHQQYTFTPAALMILVVAIALGWIRQRYNTTVSILTHFTYNFIPLALSVMYSDQALSWLSHL
jgi:membrane protease YdiL (CAAX protease family)